MKTESKSSRKKIYTAPALEKGLDLLELLSKESTGLRISDITERLGRSVGELFRMLVVLEQRGYVVNTPNSDLYSLSMKMFEVSHRYPPIKKLVSAAEEIISQLVYDVKQSCHIVIYHGGKGHVVAQKDPPSERMFSIRLGAVAPIVSTCSGHVLLAFADKEKRARMLKDIPEGHPTLTEERVNKMVKNIQKYGYERIASIQVQGVEDIGFPVFDHTGKVIAALIIPFLSYLDDTHPIKIDTALTLTKEAAKKLSNNLGYEES